METIELPIKNFRIILLKKFSELQEYRNRKLNEVREQIHEQNEKFNKEIEIIRPTRWKYQS